MLKKTLTLSLLFGLAAQVNASTNPAKLRGIIASHEWSQGVAACDFLPDQETGRSDRGKKPGSHYAELAALCAAVESGAGDDQAADWLWFTAMALDAKTALDLLPELRSNGLLQHLSPPRDRVTNIVKKGANPQVTLLTGEEVDGERPSYVTPSLAPAWFHVINKVAVDLVIGSDGIARQPLLLAGHNDPLQVFVTLAFMRQWHFSPAKVAGQPATSTYVIVLKAQ